MLEVTYTNGTITLIKNGIGFEHDATHKMFRVRTPRQTVAIPDHCVMAIGFVVEEGEGEFVYD